ncbi:MAG: WD40/YVTN/BNR-like repeat-containing protein [Vulcanimicrobiaceae bacterium]
MLASPVRRLAAALLFASPLLLAPVAAGAGEVARLAAPVFGDLRYRWIGPAVMGGRIDAVAGVPGDPNLIYLGHSSGGLWKSENGGLSFASVFAAGTSTAIGAVAIDPRNPQVVYAGTGEGFPRNTADAGDGIWKTRNGGKTWKYLGLRASGSIAKIAIDPQNDRVLLAAVMGTEFAPSTERGIYRSTDGGAHWVRVLYVNDTTGGSDVAFDPKNGHVVYAGTFDYLRKPWTMRSGGPGSGLYRSADAGRTWTRLTDPRLRNGLPAGPINRVGVSICAGDPQVVYAFVPVRHGMLYRTTDGGQEWTLQNASYGINFRPFYFSQVRCDPRDANRVYAVAGALMVSANGGKTFRDIGGGGDNHDLWIDPRNARRLLDGSDMGFHFSVDGGKTWSYDDVVPFDQVYRVGYDMAVPYHVMGGMQDHEVWWGPNTKLSLEDGVGNGDWLDISDWGDGQYAMADPSDPNTVYEDTHFGDLVRLNMRTGQRRYISPQPIVGFGGDAATYAYRFNWSAPLLISRFDSHVVYFGGNVLFESKDRGSSWNVISPDLTHCKPGELGPSGGPITDDDTNAETYCTIYSIAQDARDPNTLWIGTDTGHLDITRDGGKSWTDVTGNLRGLPPGGRISSIAASPTQPGTAYAAIDRHRSNDYAPYAYATFDYGKTWTNVSRGLRSYVHVVREDPRNPNVLYAGTESGTFVSLDRGAHWTDLRLGLPHVPVYDLRVQPRDNDLILGTHGRGFYILDDLTPIQQLGTALRHSVYVFPPMPALRYAYTLYTEHGRGAFVAQNKPYGALISFYLAFAPPAIAKAKPTVEVRILDAAGKLVDEFATSAHAGINRTAWNLQMLPPSGRKTVQDPRAYYVFYPMKITGPEVLPGRYTVQIATEGRTVSAPLIVRMAPNDPATLARLRAQQRALLELDAIQERAEVAIVRLGARRAEIVKREAEHLPPVERTRLTGLARAVNARLDTLRNPEPSGYRKPAELSEQVAYLRDTIAQYEGPPTRTQALLIARYRRAVDAAVKAADRLLDMPLEPASVPR